MSFWDITKTVGKFAFNAAKETSNKLQEAKQEMLEKNDSELKGIAKNRSGIKKMAALSELKSRGHNISKFN